MENPFARKWVNVLGPALGVVLMTALVLHQVSADGVRSVWSGLYIVGWLLALSSLVVTANRELRSGRH